MQTSIISLDNTEYELTADCGITLTSLLADTSYQVDVCIITAKGKGPMSSLNARTDSAGIRNKSL